MAQSKRLDEPHPLMTSILDVIDLCHASKSFGTTLVERPSFCKRSHLVQIVVGYGSTRARSNRFNELVPVVISILFGRDLCQWSKLVPQDKNRGEIVPPNEIVPGNEKARSAFVWSGSMRAHSKRLDACLTHRSYCHVAVDGTHDDGGSSNCH